MNLKKIDKLPRKFSNRKQENEWLKIFSQRSEMIFAIWNERNRYLKLFLISAAIILFQTVAIICLGFRASNNIKLIWTRVEKNTGAIVGTDIVTKNNMKVGEDEIKYFIQKFVLDVRTVPMDKKYYNDKIQEQSFYLTNASQEKLNNMVRNDGILTLISERRTSSAKIISVNKVTNTNNTYQVRWSEEIFGPNGEKNETRNYIGMFTVDYAVLNTEEEYLKNPLGIIIKDFSISRENN
jgi:hypothetical protein